jgi:kynurenine formamidase
MKRKLKNEAPRAKARGFPERNTERPLCIRTLKGTVFWPRTYKRYILLSYILSEKTPLYPGTPRLSLRHIRQIREKDTCNTAWISLSNHAGTHIDAPKHFWERGLSISDYGIGEFIFSSPLLINCPKQDGELISPQDLKRRLIKNCDLLLIRTGFYKYRGKDKYCFRNPALSPETAMWLRMNYPDIRAIGVDCISISSFVHRELGHKTHRILLQNNVFKGQPVLLIEDMNLSADLKALGEVIVAPLYVAGIDSVPCTVIGVLEYGNKRHNF